MSVTPNNNKNVAQLIDANLDRAREGLRVIEDWCRFGLKEKELVITIKNWRHQLGLNHLEVYKKARSTSSDQGAGLSHPNQNKRIQPSQIVAANFARAQEALRVLEEFSRHSHPELSKISAKIRYELYDLELIVLKASNINQRLEKLRSSKLYLITKPHKQIIDTVSAALKAGVSMVQFRCKDQPDIEILSKAKELSLICKSYNSLFIVNDRLDIALASDADGVHLGQQDLPIELAREIIGPEKIIGLSTHSLKQIQLAENQNCDYLGIGPIYESNSKKQEQYLGTNFIKRLKLQTDIPWFVIGGINSVNLSKVKNAGAKRVAVISAIMDSKDPYSTSKELLEILQ